MLHDRPPRTLLEAEARRRGWTVEEGSRYAEKFAREHGMNATLSPRHLQRLMAGQSAHGQPLGPLRPATRRLLEAIFGRPVAELLDPPGQTGNGTPAADDPAAELRARLAASHTINRGTVDLFQQKLELTRILDRRLGALRLLGELRELIRQVEEVLCYTLRPDIRAALARVLVDCSTLAGWQSLDRGEIREAWQHYDRAKTAARESQSSEMEAYATAAQAVVLIDIAAPESAIELTDHARSLCGVGAPPTLRAWLAAANGEAHAAHGNREECLRAFDAARSLLPEAPDTGQTPYIVFGHVHLNRWRGSAMARLGDTEAVSVLLDALEHLEPEFSRAEAALHIDLVRLLTVSGDNDGASAHARRAHELVCRIGSCRQRDRLSAALAG